VAPVSRENAQAKGLRYLCEHRLTVLRVNGDDVEAECRGAGAVYRLGYRDGEWFCGCPAKTTCSHLHALMAVTVRGIA
jgi:SWIM zinc finger